jgi:hypothetical protein
MERILAAKPTWAGQFDDGAVLSAAVAHSAHGCIDVLERAGASAKVKKTKDRDLLLSALFNDVVGERPKLVRRMLGMGAPVDGNEGEIHPLGAACLQRDMEVARILLAAGADVDKKDDEGVCALIHALSEIDDQEDIARSEKMVDLLLEAKAAADARDCFDESALHFACANGVAGAVGLLLDAGAKPWAKNNVGSAPMALAIENGQEEAGIALARSLAPKSAPSSQWYSLAKDASGEGMDDLASLLRSKGESRDLDAAAGGKNGKKKAGGGLRV